MRGGGGGGNLKFIKKKFKKKKKNVLSKKSLIQNLQKTTYFSQSIIQITYNVA